MDSEETQPVQVTTVTKQKSLGRIQAGLKLAEWNKNNKQKLREKRETKSTEEFKEESKQESVAVHESSVAVHDTKNKPVITVMVGFVTGVSIVGYMLYRKWNSTKQRSIKQKPLSEKQTATHPEEKHTKCMPIRLSADPFFMQ